LIVGTRVSQAPNDKKELRPNLTAVQRHVSPATVLIDSGFVSEEAVTAAERDADGPERRCAICRTHAPPPPAARSTNCARNPSSRSSACIIKEVPGFRRFSLRGLAKVSLEWDLLTLAYNLKRLGANLRAA